MLIDPRRIVEVNGRLFNTLNDKEIVNQMFYYGRNQLLRPLDHLKEEPNGRAECRRIQDIFLVGRGVVSLNLNPNSRQNEASAREGCMNAASWVV